MKQCSVCKCKTVLNQGKLHVCDSCGHGYRSYSGDIVEFHKEEYRNTHKRNQKEFLENTVTELFHDARKAIVENRLKLIKKYLDKSDYVLDIGSGAGTFAKRISPFVHSVDCLELDPRLIEESIRLGFKTFKQDFLSQEITTKYQIVFAWHVLEHIDDIHEFLKKCQTISDKYVIIEVPVNRKPSKNFEGHLHYFTKESLKILCESSGLKTVSILNGVQKPAILGIFNNRK